MGACEFSAEAGVSALQLNYAAALHLTTSTTHAVPRQVLISLLPVTPCLGPCCLPVSLRPWLPAILAPHRTMDEEHFARTQTAAIGRRTTFDEAAIQQPSRRSTTNGTTPVTRATSRSSQRSNPLQLLRALTIPNHKVADPPSLMHGIKAIIMGSCKFTHAAALGLLAHSWQGLTFCSCSYPSRCVPSLRPMTYDLTGLCSGPCTLPSRAHSRTRPLPSSVSCVFGHICTCC